jgi:methyl-accepting chemotaxis protein
MNIFRKLLLLVGAAALAIATVGGVGLSSLYNVLLKDRQYQIETMLYMGENLVKHYYGLEQKGALSREEAQKQAKAALSQLRHGVSYYWVRLPDGLNLVHPDAKNRHDRAGSDHGWQTGCASLSRSIARRTYCTGDDAITPP